MPRPTLRFASGSPTEPYSSVWRVSADNAKGDVYVSWSKKVADTIKISLHQSGVWRYAATKESGATFGGGDRVIKRWTRPPEHVPCVTRGPGIIVPLTSAGSRTLFAEDLSAKIKWFRPPALSEIVEFDIYFLSPGADGNAWGNAELIGSLSLGHGRSICVVATVRTDIPSLLVENSELFIREGCGTYSSLDDFAGGSLIWMQESEDNLRTPVLIDLPLTARYRREDLTLSEPTAKGAPGRGRTLRVNPMIRRL